MAQMATIPVRMESTDRDRARSEARRRGISLVAALGQAVALWVAEPQVEESADLYGIVEDLDRRLTRLEQMAGVA